MDEAVFHVEHFEVTPSSELPHWRAPPRKRSPRSTACSGAGRNGTPNRAPCGMSVFGSAIGRSCVSSCRDGAVPVSGQDFTPSFLRTRIARPTTPVASSKRLDGTGCRRIPRERQVAVVNRDTDRAIEQPLKTRQQSKLHPTQMELGPALKS